MGKTAKRSDPELWEAVKAEVTRGAKGGRPGEWSARKAQLAAHLYKARGGGYEGAPAPAKAHRGGERHLGGALCRGQAAQPARPVEDDQGRARGGALLGWIRVSRVWTSGVSARNIIGKALILLDI